MAWGPAWETGGYRAGEGGMRGDRWSCLWEVRSRLGGLGGESCGEARVPRLERGEESVFGRGEGERRTVLFGAGWWAGEESDGRVDED